MRLLAPGRRLLQQGLLGFARGLHFWEWGPDPRLQTFARARGLGRWCTLHFKFDGDATLYVRVFGEDGRRAGCCPEDDDRGRLPSPGTDQDEDGDRRTGGGARGSLSFGDSLSGSSSSSGGRDQPPRRRARLGEGSGSARRRAPVKREKGSA